MIEIRARRRARRAPQANPLSALAQTTPSPLLARLSSTWALAAMIGVCALACALYGLGNKTIWWDESFSLYMARQPAPVVWNNVWNWQPNMMAYYLVLFVWLKFVAWAGALPTEFIVRIPSALFGTGSAVVVFLLARRTWGVKVGLLAGGLYLLNTFEIQYAQEERSYSLQLLLITLSWYGLLAALTAQHARRWWALYIIASSLSVYAQFVSALVILSQLVAFALLMTVPTAWRARVRALFWDFAVSVVAAGALIFPIAAAAERDPHPNWVPIAHLHDLMNLAITYSSGSIVYLTLAALIGALGILYLTVPRLRGGAGVHLHAEAPASGVNHAAATPEAQAVAPGVLVLLCWLMIPVAVAFVTAQPYLNLHLFLTRYLIVGMPAYCLLIALTLSAVYLRVLRVGLAVVLLGVALAQVPGYYASVDTHGYRAPTLWLQQHFRPGDGMVYVYGFWAYVPMSYYMQAYPGPAHDDHSPPSVDQFSDNVTMSTYAATHTRVFLISAGGNGIVLDSDVQKWLDAHYRLADSIADSSVSIRLYDTGAPAASGSNSVSATGMRFPVGSYQNAHSTRGCQPWHVDAHTVDIPAESQMVCSSALSSHLTEWVTDP
jgi:mannosyltransferase